MTLIALNRAEQNTVGMDIEEQKTTAHQKKGAVTAMAELVEVTRCKDCKLSSAPKAVSRHDLYCNDYDVRFCEKEQKIVCGTHFCSHGSPKERNGNGDG